MAGGLSLGSFAPQRWKTRDTPPFELNCSEENEEEEGRKRNKTSEKHYAMAGMP